MNEDIRNQLEQQCRDRYETFKAHETECRNITFVAMVSARPEGDFVLVTYDRKTKVFTCDKYNFEFKIL